MIGSILLFSTCRARQERRSGAMGSLSITRFAIKGPALLLPQRQGDRRGWFCEVWNRADWREAGLPEIGWVQDNEAYSAQAGTLRGLHFQTPPHAQAKLVRVLQGAICDVIVDLRAGSDTFGQHLSVTLEASTGEQLFVPRGFAHGYQTLAPDTHVAYKCDAPYAPDAEAGLKWNDEALGIEWPLCDVRLSEKDKKWPAFSNFESPFSNA